MFLILLKGCWLWLHLLRREQSMDWLASHVDALLTIAPSLARVRQTAAEWR